MANPISIMRYSAFSDFNKLPKRLYAVDSPPLKRKFNIAEKWYIVDGEVSFFDYFTKQPMTAHTGDVITFPQKSKFIKMKFTQPTFVKQYIDDEEKRNRISTNIKINYLIIQTILEIIDQFEAFTSVPYETDWLFQIAKEGNIYKLTDDWHIVDMVIQNFVDRTGISENVWYGKRRLKTGFKYNKPIPATTDPQKLLKWFSLESIDEVDFSGYTEEQKRLAYKAIVDDPLDLRTLRDNMEDLKAEMEDLKAGNELMSDIQIPQYNPTLHSLNNLLIFVARQIREEEKDLVNNVFPDDIVLRQPRNSGNHLNNKGMPPYILYGNELVTIIKHLFWVNSVGLEKRLKLKDF